ncbi:YchF/TatD family DNA exonuclease [Candidatus Providencia siddallii]|uniref:Uncharacterized metal-dependent hydrolase YcfH n=1 Tax=Candidatus Providencia siddallii TaxID=1715285 RepID=A0ABP1CDZ0_9GAMM
MFIIDSHCHIDCLNYKKVHIDVNDVVIKAYKHNVKFMLSVSTTLQHFKNMKKLIGKRDDIAFSCGIHPLNLKKKCNFEHLEKLSEKKEVIALGETGLDYYHKYNCDIKLQQEAFRKHIQIAKKLKKPIIVHNRSSTKDVITILREEKIMDCGGILHSFTEDENIAKIFLDLGMYISFSGIITFNNAEHIRKAVKIIPLDKILVETDSPYLTPVPFRGKENQPAYTYNIIKYISELKNIDIEILSEITTNNFNRLFCLKLNNN